MAAERGPGRIAEEDLAISEPQGGVTEENDSLESGSSHR
jgi:hypothetical protein